MLLLSTTDSSRRMNMRHVSAPVSPSNGLRRRRPITVNSPLNLMCGALAFYSPNWLPTDAYPIQVSHCVFIYEYWLIDWMMHSYSQLSAGMTNAEVLTQVEHGYRMPMPPNCEQRLYDIMLECWHKDPMRRPTFETLQWKLEDFYTSDQSDYKEAQAYW